MVPTVYPTIFLDLCFSEDLQSYNIFKYYFLGKTYNKGGLISEDEANWILAEPINIEGVIAKYYPEFNI